jgi:hypothetical protein
MIKITFDLLFQSHEIQPPDPELSSASWRIKFDSQLNFTFSVVGLLQEVSETTSVLVQAGVARYFSLASAR